MEERMKKIWSLLLILGMLAGITSACTINMVTGSGKLAKSTRNVSGFTGVQFAGLGELSITQGTSEGLTIEGEDNILPKIVTEVRSGVLYIGFERENWQDVVRPTKDLKFDLKVKTLNSLDLTGLGNVTIPKLQADNLTVKVSGAGGVKVQNASAKALTLTMSGAGNVEMAGKIPNQTITMSGLGNYAGGDLDSSTATVSVTGAGGATVWVRDALTVKISGAGSVSYYGTPKVTKEVTGLGVINSQGTK